MTKPWAEVVGAIRYGYAPVCWLQVEGVDVIPIERCHDAPTPSGYTLEPILVIDRTSLLGSRLSDQDNLGAAFDFEARFLDLPSTRALFAPPTRAARLVEDTSATDTSWRVGRVEGWSGVSKLYLGTSCETWAGTSTLDTFTGLTRGDFGRARSYKRGALVTDRPREWEEREVTLWMGLIDPTGRFVSSSGDLYDDATVVWSGHVLKRPRRKGTEWVLQCRDQVRRLQMPLGVAATGKARWSLDTDGLYRVNSFATLTVTIKATATLATIMELTVYLFDIGGPTERRASQIRAAVLQRLEAAAADYADPDHDRFQWQKTHEVRGSAIVNTWQLWVVRTDGVNISTFASASASPPCLRAIGGAAYSGANAVRMGVHMEETVALAALEVTLDDPSAVASLPEPGAVVLEVGGENTFRRYTAITPSDTDSRVVLLLPDPSTQSAQDLSTLATELIEGQVSEGSVRFLWSCPGSLSDALRKTLVSTGDGIRGTFDTLPKGQGLALPYLDEASFEEVFGEVFSDITPEFLVDTGTTFAAMISGLLRLSRTAIVSRRSTDGARLELAAVKIAQVESTEPAATITDDLLVSVDGKWPIEEVGGFEPPQTIVVKCRRFAIGAEREVVGEATFTAPDLTDWSRSQWKLDLFGLSRDQVAPGAGRGAAFHMAAAIFSKIETYQVVRLTLPAWVGPSRGLAIGDVLYLNTEDPNLWDYRRGRPGFLGYAAVVGVQVDPRRLYQEVIVWLEAGQKAQPMAPSLEVLAVNGTATSPTSIDFDEAHLALLTRAKGSSSSWRLLAYLPGQDTGHAEYLCGAISSPGGGVVRVAVTTAPSSPTVSLTTSYRVTWPVSAQSTTAQLEHLHTDDLVIWG